MREKPLIMVKALILAAQNQQKYRNILERSYSIVSSYTLGP